MKVFSAVLALSIFGASIATYSDEFGARQGKLKPTKFLKTYQGFVNDFYRKNDAYRMEYNVGDSARFEQRTDSGEVTGTYAFVAPEGDEYEFKYQANDEGFKVEGDALPKAVEETDDVKAAREAFFEAYEKQLELAGDYEYDSDEDDDDESSEESSEEDSDEYGEDSDESDEDDDDDDDDDEEEESQSSNFRRQSAPRSASNFFSVPYPYSRRS